jgi:hypothetical protein
MSSWQDVQGSGSDADEGKLARRVAEEFAGSRILIEALSGWPLSGGKPTVPVKISIFCEMGRVKLCINDPARKRLGFVTVVSVGGDLLESIIQALQGEIEWRKAKEKPKWTSNS